MNTWILLTLTGLGTGALYFLMGAGLALIVGLMKVLNFAHGAIMAAGAFAGWVLLSAVDQTPSVWQILLALLLGGLVGAALGVAFEVLLLRRLFGRELELLLLTVGVGIAAIALMQGIWGADEQGMKLPSWLTSGSQVLGARVPNDRFVLIATAVAVYVLILVFLRYTRHGLVVRAAVENREMVEALGINVRASVTLVFGIGCFAAGMAGVLQGIFDRSVTPTMGNSVLIFSFIVLIIGGLGSITGAFIAAGIVGLLQSYSNYYISLGIGDVLVVACLAIMLLFRPQGLFGSRERLV